jgi:hypothetical protein
LFRVGIVVVVVDDVYIVVVIVSIGDVSIVAIIISVVVVVGVLHVDISDSLICLLSLYIFIFISIFRH